MDAQGVGSAVIMFNCPFLMRSRRGIVIAIAALSGCLGFGASLFDSAPLFAGICLSDRTLELALRLDAFCSVNTGLSSTNSVISKRPLSSGHNLRRS